MTRSDMQARRRGREWPIWLQVLGIAAYMAAVYYGVIWVTAALIGVR